MCYLQPTDLSTNTSKWSKWQNSSIREIDHRVLEHQFNWNLESGNKAVCHKELSSATLFSQLPQFFSLVIIHCLFYPNSAFITNRIDDLPDIKPS